MTPFVSSVVTVEFILAREPNPFSAGQPAGKLPGQYPAAKCDCHKPIRLVRHASSLTARQANGYIHKTLNGATRNLLPRLLRNEGRGEWISFLQGALKSLQFILAHAFASIWLRLAKTPFCCGGGRPRLPWSRGVPPGGKAVTARNLSRSHFIS
jgi:hypothetical protein